MHTCLSRISIHLTHPAPTHLSSSDSSPIYGRVASRPRCSRSKTWSLMQAKISEPQMLIKLNKLLINLLHMPVQILMWQALTLDKSNLTISNIISDNQQQVILSRSVAPIQASPRTSMQLRISSFRRKMVSCRRWVQRVSLETSKLSNQTSSYTEPRMCQTFIELVTSVKSGKTRTGQL